MKGRGGSSSASGRSQRPGDDKAEIPFPIAQRIKAIVPAYRALQLSLNDISADDYKASLRSSDAAILNAKVYPLERAWEVVNNCVVELVRLGLGELGIPAVGGPRDLEAFAEERILTKRLADQLAGIHRARKQLTHDYPDVRAGVMYPACEQLVKVLPAFLKAYTTWLRDLGRGSRAEA